MEPFEPFKRFPAADKNAVDPFAAVVVVVVVEAFDMLPPTVRS